MIHDFDGEKCTACDVEFNREVLGPKFDNGAMEFNREKCACRF